MLGLATIDILLAGLGAFVIGVSKGGFKGIFILTVTLMALVFGSKASTGIIVPLLICGDILAVIYYNRHAKWKLLFKFLPWMVFGVLVGVIIGKDMPEDIFKNIMAGIILLSVIGMFYWEKKDEKNFSGHILFRGSMGFLAGVTTMLGNLAGAFSNIYFLSTRIPKNEFIGTAAWLFFIINLFKLPFHIFTWETINLHSLKVDLLLLPFVLLGFVAGVKLVGLINELFFRRFILFATAFGAILLLIK